MKTSQFLTRTFFDIYPTVASFGDDVVKLGNEDIKAMDENDVQYLYMTIASKYGDSRVRYTNEFLFSLSMFRQINTYWPVILTFNRDQKKLRDGSDEDFMRGGRSILNQGAHNTADVSLDTEVGINQLDAQAITNMQRGIFGVLQERAASYKKGKEDDFLKTLVPLFMQILTPMADLLYGTDPNLKEDE